MLVGLALQGGHSACFSFFYFIYLFIYLFHLFSYFEHMFLKNIIFSKMKGPPVILLKVNLSMVDSEQRGYEMGFLKGNLFSKKESYWL